MKKYLSKSILAILLFIASRVFATGESGTYFNIFVPPNNEAQGKDVALIVTAVEDNTDFQIIDTPEDGDSDDNASGTLKTGQSYVLFLRNNGVNDDAPHAGETNAKQDGDHFIIKSSKLLLVSQATASSWQHDWLPATNKTSKGSKFYVYGNQATTSPNDINVMAFESNTVVTVYKISKAATLQQGYTNIDIKRDTLVMKRTISPGQDLIYYYHDGRDLIKPGETYMIETNKDVTIQYGSLYGEEHDGGGYVPSSAGSSSGELFYFTVPYEDSMQQEVRVISWSDNTRYTLEYYKNGQWITLKSALLNKLKADEWVGKIAGQTLPVVFRVRGTSGKLISVVEDNWIETGSKITSDIATVATAVNGTTAGTSFLVYMPPPCNQGNITSPFTHTKLPARATHAYIFGNKNSVTHVTVKDANTNGATINRTYTIPAGYYADCVLDSAQWNSIYNGNGNPASGSQRPYLQIQSDATVSLMLSNHNDNWMMHYGTSMQQDFTCNSSCDHPQCRPGDTVVVTTCLRSCGPTVQQPHISQQIADGCHPLSAILHDSTAKRSYRGIAYVDKQTGHTVINFPDMDVLDSTHIYWIENQVVPGCKYLDGTAIEDNTVLTIQTSVTGTANGDMQEALSTVGIADNISDTSNYSTMAGFNVSANPVHVGNDLVLTATGSAKTYSWTLGNGQSFTGPEITYNYPVPGVYTVQLVTTNGYGCTYNTSQVISVTSSATTTGMSDEPKENTIGVWSAENKVFVDFRNAEVLNAQIKMYNVLGQELCDEKYTGNNVYVKEINTVPAAYIIVTVKCGEAITTRKVYIHNTK